MRLTKEQISLMKEITQDAGHQDVDHYKGASFTATFSYVFTEEDAAEIGAPVAGHRMTLKGRGEYDWGTKIDEVILEEPRVINNEAAIWRKLNNVRWEPNELERLEALIPRTTTTYKPITIEVTND